MGGEKCSALMKVYILTGYDVTSLIGTEVSAAASKPENYLNNFGIEPLRDFNFVCAERYLLRVINLKSNCETFNDLRYQIYKTKEKAQNELPPTSSTISGHLLKSHYIMYLFSNLLDSCSKILQLANYGWIIENRLLVPIKNFAMIPKELWM